LILEDIMKKNPNTPVPELLDQAFTSVDQQLEKLPVKNSGCTVVAAVLRWEDRIPSATGSIALTPAVAATASESEAVPDHAQTPTQTEQNATPAEPTAGEIPSPTKEVAARLRVLYTANVGDARIVLCRNGKALRLSYDHKGSDENEGKRIASAGGLILNNRVNGVLAVTRALGDAYMKELVTGHPYTTETVIQADQDEFLILACDGLWDVCTDQEAVDLVRNTKDAQEASKLLVDHALSRFSTDNLSCMVVRFDSDLTRDIEQRSESLGVEGDLSSKKDGVNEADEISEGAKRSLESSDGAGAASGLNEKLKASVESPGSQLSVVDNKATGLDVTENPKTTTGKE
jgi:protein phosphatase PTC1